jgi:hypothetical protein
MASQTVGGSARVQVTRWRQWAGSRIQSPSPSAVFFLALDAQVRRALDQQHPLVSLLIVPLAFRRRLTGRDDALDAQALALDKQVHDLIWQGPSR